MEAQEVFNKVVLHLHDQGYPAIGPTGECVYRGINGSSCAVGCLIPEEKYTRRIENISICDISDTKYKGYSITSRGQILKDILKDLNLWEHVPLLIQLQEAHDMWDSELNIGWYEVLKRLQEIAKDFGLTFPELPPKG